MTIKLNITLRNFCIAQVSIVTVFMLLAFVPYLFTRLTGYDDLFGFLRLLDVGNELSLPTYFSVLNLLFASVLIFVIYIHEKANQQARAGYWLLLSALFLYLSADEAAEIHETFWHVTAFLKEHGIIGSIIKHNLWLPFGVLFVIGVSTVFLPFIIRLPAGTRLYFVIAGTVFLTGAIGFEYVGALMLGSGMVESRNDFIYQVRRLFEEGFEMYGIVIFNCALYREILRRKISVTIESE